MIATCHTEGCENVDIPIDIGDIESGVMVVCGVCGQTISDVAAPAEPEPG